MKKLLQLMSISAILTLATPSFAQIHLDIHIGPPAPRHEVIVESPYAGATWVPGYYSFDGGAYVWVPGRWERPPRENAYWVEPRYERHGDHYDYFAGRWADKHDNGLHKGWAKQEERGDHAHNGHDR